MNIVEKLLGLFQCMGFSRHEMLEFLTQWIEREEDITIELVKEKLKLAIKDGNFNWVELAIKTKLVYTSKETSPIRFDVDELLIFTDSFRWKEVVQLDAILTIDQRDELKEQFRAIGVQYFDNIYELIGQQDFEWLPFEVKHAFKVNFGEITYTNDDIIFYLKTIIWQYLFPNSFDSDRLNSIKAESIIFLQNQQINEGWTEMFQVMQAIKDCFPGIDLYELSRVEWDKNIQYKMHYRNPFALGFQRISYTLETNATHSFYNFVQSKP